MKQKRKSSAKGAIYLLPFCLLGASLLGLTFLLYQQAHQEVQQDPVGNASLLSMHLTRHQFTTCHSLTAAIQESRGKGRLLSLLTDIGDSNPFFDEAMNNQNYEGTVTVSPNQTFSIFNNSTMYQQGEASSKKSSQLPNRLARMSFKEFHERSRPGAGSGLQGLHYGEEFYYFQGDPPKASMEALRSQGPLQCSTDGTQGWWVRKAKFRAASAGSRHAMHYDQSHTLLMQLSGTKIMTLVPPSQLKYMYPYPASDLNNRRARVDVENPDTVRYPKSRRLTPFNITLQPGELLFMPRHTGHGVRVLEDSTSLSFRLDFAQTTRF